MKKIFLNLAFLTCTTWMTVAQDSLWTMDDCMRYAVDNSYAVRKQMLTNDTYKAEYQSSVASFFPTLTASASAQYNFGRAIDPGTNTYVNTTTFNNGYDAYASLPVFNGGQLVNQFRLAKTTRQSGMNDLQKSKDDLALNTMEAYVNAVYYQGTVRFAGEKLEESNRTLYKIRREEELGIKGKADVAQIEAQVAGDDYNLTYQQNLFNIALLKLKEYMNYPLDEELKIDTTDVSMDYIFANESIEDIYNQAKEVNPTALQAEYQLRTNKLTHLIQKGRLFPTISVSTGVSTSYYENLKSETAPASFNSQFKNNRGEYVSFGFRLPLFSGLTRMRDIRRARNNVRIAEEQQSEVLRQLRTAIEQSVLERDGFAKESVQMEKKLKSDEIAYQITLRKFEEGLMSPIDLQTSSNTLIESKAMLLLKKLMYRLKCRQVDYYKGEPLVVTSEE
ncbi:MAG: TolC family protein [Tannerella sp.]|jgi:outer membrane protein|nr:TolC family protein [Tannerella sp.]